jgi:GT2 family glycosyltransferase
MVPPVALSVVIPTRDSRALTLSCLGSLPHDPRLQILLVDDSSQDGTAEAVAEGFPAVELLRTPSPLGFGGAANAGLARARGDLLLLLNSDARVDPGALDRLAAAFAARPRLGIAGGELRYPDGSPQWSGGREPGLAWLFGLGSGLPALLGRLGAWRRVHPLSGRGERVDWVTGAALALRRQVWLTCGPLDEGYRLYGQDMDLCLRARRAGWEVAVVPGFTAVHLQGATIGAAAGATAARQNPELLWTDLLRWAGKERGPRWAGRAARWLAAGARLRLAGRRLGLLAVGQPRRDQWRRETHAFRVALAAVRQAERFARGGQMQ